MTKTYEECRAQFSALRKTYDYLVSKKDRIIAFYQEKAPKSLTYTGCGSGYCLCRSAEFSAKVRVGIPASSIAAGDLLLNFPAYENMLKGTMLIAPSRSGSTSEVIKAVRQMKSRWQLPLIAISCVEGSELSTIADLSLELPWAYDESVCQTRTVTNLYTADLLLLAFLSGDEKLADDIDTAIAMGDAFMNAYEENIKAIASREWTHAVLIADGELAGLASEGAVAFNEIPQILSNQFNVLDVRHGPMVMIGKKTLVIACLDADETTYQKDLIRDIKNRGATVVTYSDLPLRGFDDIGNFNGTDLQITSGKRLDVAARGIHFILIPQLLSCYKAEVAGIDPDHPEGLTAWIKL